MSSQNRLVSFDNLTRLETALFLTALSGALSLLALSIKSTLTTNTPSTIEQQLFGVIFFISCAALAILLVSYYTTITIPTTLLKDTNDKQ